MPRPRLSSVTNPVARGREDRTNPHPCIRPLTRKFPLGDVAPAHLTDAEDVFERLMKDYKRNSIVRERADCEFQEFRPSLSKPILDEIDAVLAKHYGFTAEELDFIVNYDIKYRLGRDSESEE
jgi:hypothetical protein